MKRLAIRVETLRLLVLIFCAVGLSYFIAQRIVMGVQTTEIRSCHRLNILRSDDNRNQLADYNFDKLFITLIARSARMTQTRAQARLTAEFVEGLHAQADAKAWIPLTNCYRAVYANVPAPQPIAFGVRLPPRSALVLGKEN